MLVFRGKQVKPQLTVACRSVCLLFLPFLASVCVPCRAVKERHSDRKHVMHYLVGPLLGSPCPSGNSREAKLRYLMGTFDLFHGSRHVESRLIPLTVTGWRFRARLHDEQLSRWLIDASCPCICQVFCVGCCSSEPKCQTPQPHFKVLSAFSASYRGTSTGWNRHSQEKGEHK